MKRLARFLSVPRWFTSDLLKAKHSIFQWVEIQDEYSLSILGALNRFLPKLPGNPVLVIEIESETNQPNGKIYFKKKWW